MWKISRYSKIALARLRQDNNPSQEAADEMAEKNWGPVLQGIKEVAEKR